jgi:hypothetical protein
MSRTLIKLYWNYEGKKQVLSFSVPNDTCRVKVDDMYNNGYGLIEIWGCSFKQITVKGMISDIQYGRKEEPDMPVDCKLYQRRKIPQYYSSYKDDGCIGSIMYREGCDVIIEPVSGWCGRSEFPSFTRVVIERRGSYGAKKECDFEISDETKIAGFDTESGLFCSLKNKRSFEDF